MFKVQEIKNSEHFDKDKHDLVKDLLNTHLRNNMLNPICAGGYARDMILKGHSEGDFDVYIYGNIHTMSEIRRVLGKLSITYDEKEEKDYKGNSNNVVGIFKCIINPDIKICKKYNNILYDSYLDIIVIDKPVYEYISENFISNMSKSVFDGIEFKVHDDFLEGTKTETLTIKNVSGDSYDYGPEIQYLNKMMSRFEFSNWTFDLSTAIPVRKFMEHFDYIKRNKKMKIRTKVFDKLFKSDITHKNIGIYYKNYSSDLLPF